MKKLDSFPRVPLGIFPTPIQKLERISERLQVNVYIKRDDLCGVGLGGNKIRKLEFLLAEALAQGFELCFVKGIGQVVEHVFGATSFCFFRLSIGTLEHVAKDSDFRPQIVVAEPHDKLADGARPYLIVQNP